MKLGFRHSLIDKSVFNCDIIVFLVYVDDSIFVSFERSDIDKTIKKLQCKNLKIKEQDHPADYVGVNIIRLANNSYTFTQLELTCPIIYDVGLGPNNTTNSIPMCDQRLLHHHLDSPPYDDSKFNYRSVIVNLNYLSQCPQPGIVYKVHQCTSFSSHPCQEHT